MNFEDDLRAALRREQPPADFAARVLAKAAQTERVVAFPVWRRPATWAMAAGLAVAALVPPAVLEYRHREEQRALEAKNSYSPCRLRAPNYSKPEHGFTGPP